ncbi:MAG: HAD family hydrolase [Terriglobales bacterium]
MSCKAVLFDLDHTLYDYESAHISALDAAVEWFRSTFSLEPGVVRDQYRRARQHIHDQLHGFAASHSRLLYFQTMIENMQLSPPSRALEAEEVYWSTFLESMQLRNGVLPLLQFLALHNIPVAIASDLTTQIQLRKLARLGLEPYIKILVTSEQAGREKPSPEIFLLACRKLNRSEKDTIMIGDSYERDVKGATALGMPCFLLLTGEEEPQLSASEKNLVQTFREFDALWDPLAKAITADRPDSLRVLNENIRVFKANQSEEASHHGR